MTLISHRNSQCVNWLNADSASPEIMLIILAVITKFARFIDLFSRDQKLIFISDCLTKTLKQIQSGTDKTIGTRTKLVVLTLPGFHRHHKTLVMKAVWFWSTRTGTPHKGDRPETPEIRSYICDQVHFQQDDIPTRKNQTFEQTMSGK